MFDHHKLNMSSQHSSNTQYLYYISVSKEHSLLDLFHHYMRSKYCRGVWCRCINSPVFSWETCMHPGHPTVKLPVCITASCHILTWLDIAFQKAGLLFAAGSLFVLPKLSESALKSCSCFILCLTGNTKLLHITAQVSHRRSHTSMLGVNALKQLLLPSAWYYGSA